MAHLSKYAPIFFLPCADEDYKLGISVGLSNKANLIFNVMATLFTQVSTMLVSIVLTPLLINRIGKELYGHYVSGISLTYFCVVLCDLGMTLYLVKETSENREDKNYIGELMSASSIIKIPCLLLMLSVYYFFYPGGYFFSVGLPFWLVLAASSLQPFWAFQGMERLKAITMMTFVARASTLMLVFSFVENAEDFDFVLLSYLAPILLVTVFSFIYLSKQGIAFRKAQYLLLKQIVSESISFFTSRVLVAVYTQATTFVVSRFYSVNEAAVYAVADQFYKVGQMSISAITQALYPHVVFKKDVRFLARVALLLLGVAIISTLVLWNCVSVVVDWYVGPAFIDSVPIVKIFMCVCVCTSASALIGLPLFSVFGLHKLANKATSLGSMIYLLLLAIALTIGGMDILWIAAIVFTSEFAAFFARVYFIKMHVWPLYIQNIQSKTTS